MLAWKGADDNTRCAMVFMGITQILMKCTFFVLSENLLSLKRFSKQKIKTLGKEEQVLKEKNLMKSLGASAFVPEVLCTCADRRHAAILLNTCLACPLASILHTALDEPSARFCAATVVIALEDLHKVSCLKAFLHHFPVESLILQFRYD
jgi:hypothetical protein